MWWLYTHDCMGERWTLVTNEEMPLPEPGDPIPIPQALRDVGSGLWKMGHHIGLRYTTLSKASPVAILMNPAATMLRVASIGVTKPWSCRYEEPSEIKLTPRDLDPVIDDEDDVPF